MKFTVKIDRLKVFAYIGVFHAEKSLGNHFEVSATVELDIPEEIIRNDDINNTFNYSRIVEIVKDTMKVSCDLLETVALRIADKVMEMGQESDSYKILRAEVTVTKLNPPIPHSLMSGASVTVSLPQGS